MKPHWRVVELCNLQTHPTAVVLQSPEFCLVLQSPAQLHAVKKKLDICRRLLPEEEENYFRRGIQFGFDGSIIMDGERVYWLGHGTSTVGPVHTIDYFHGYHAFSGG